MLSRYTDVYDLKVIEKMVELGVYHSGYGDVKRDAPDFIELFDSISKENEFNHINQQIIPRIQWIFQRMSDLGLWQHYQDVEIPFLYSLNDLVGNGLFINKSFLMEQFPVLEIKRNILVEQLRVEGVDIPSIDSAHDYLKEKYAQADVEALLNIYSRLGSKPLANTDILFDSFNKIEKVERGSKILQSLHYLPDYVKPQYQIMGAVTGRCTAKNPNLFGLPKDYRYVVRAEQGKSIVECDYKQMEVGVLAALAQDKVLINDFNSSDVYQALALQLGLERGEAKSIFISIIYGMSASSLAKILNKRELEAQHLINEFFNRYKGVKRYQDELVSFGRQNGYVETRTGLRRQANYQVNHSHLLTPKIINWQNNWFKNFPVQANAAIIFKNAISQLAKELVGKDFKLLVPHYDAIVFQASSDNVDHYILQVEAAMIRSMRNMFPILQPKISINKNNPEHWS